jgi:putative endonuclease
MYTKRLGQEGEALARSFLEQKGFEVITTNWRHGHLELDIIAQKDDMLHIVEVKTQQAGTAGHPEESVTRKKFANLQRAAEAFMGRYPRWRRVQFDIVSVTMAPKGAPTILFIEDVYY